MALEGRAFRLEALAVSPSATGLGLLLPQMGEGQCQAVVTSLDSGAALLLSSCVALSK